MRRPRTRENVEKIRSGSDFDCAPHLASWRSEKTI